MHLDQTRIPMYRRAAPWVCWGLRQPKQLWGGCNLINWQNLCSEYQGYRLVRNFRLITHTSMWTTFLWEGLS